MASSFSLKSSFDQASIGDQFKFNNLLGFKSYQHLIKGISVNFANIAGPLYTMAVVVPTFLNDNKGKAHTLEHLIFTGSEKYPQRGFLDKLATSCMSSGTNAYTADDHTNYTFSSGSAEGLKKLVPVFLDHILHPRIEPETVDMEVFSLKVSKDESDNAKISAQGVVYCEMKSRQNSEADLLDLNLRKRICSRLESVDPVFSRFKWECGGLTKDIATLSTEEILDFHKLFYNPARISIIICGKLDVSLENEILTLIDGIVKAPENYPCLESYLPVLEDEIPSSNSNEAKLVHFPSNEDNLGSIGLAWRGAFAKDLTKVLSFHVIFKYLRETSASPLYQKFVQIENPWATDIDYEIKPLYHTIMTLIFSGVPKRPDDESSNGLTPNLIKNMLKTVFSSLMEDREEFGNSIKLCLSSFELKLIELIEDDPYETIVSYTVPELIVSAIGDRSGSPQFTFGENVSNLKKIVSELKQFPVDYWLGLLQYLLENEPVEVIMVPDMGLNDKIEKEEQEYLKDLWQTSKARVSEIPQVAPYKIEGEFEVLKDSHLTPFRFSTLSSELRTVELPGTGMKQIFRLLNFKDFIPTHLWPYLVLFQELLFQCDVNLSGCTKSQEILQHSSIIPYQSLQKILNSKFNSYGINFGLENETFSLGYCEDALSLNVTLPSSTSDLMLKDAIKLLEAIATCSQFSEERVKIVAENLYNQIQDVQKDPYEVTEAILTLSLHGMTECISSPPKKARIQNSFETEISIFKQKMFLKKISRGDSDSIQNAVSCLNQVSECIKSGLNEAPSFVQIGSSPLIIAKEESSLAENVFNMTHKSNFDVLNLPKFGCMSMNSDTGIAYAIGDITASYLSFVIPCNILPSNNICEDTIKKYVGISLICQLLSVTEGPIYSAIRGRGLAYDASLTVSVWNGLLTFAVNDSNDPFNAFVEFQKLMNRVNHEFMNNKWDIINEDSLKVAKSAFLYQMIEESATPSSMFNTCLRNYLRSIPMASSDKEENLVMRAIHESTLEDLKGAWFEYFPRLLSKEALSVLIVPKSIAQDVLERFGGVLNFELKNFNDFSGELIEAEMFDSESECSEEDDEEEDEEEEDDEEEETSNSNSEIENEN